MCRWAGCAPARRAGPVGHRQARPCHRQQPKAGPEAHQVTSRAVTGRGYNPEAAAGLEGLGDGAEVMGSPGCALPHAGGPRVSRKGWSSWEAARLERGWWGSLQVWVGWWGDRDTKTQPVMGARGEVRGPSGCAWGVLSLARPLWKAEVRAAGAGAGRAPAQVGLTSDFM